MPIYKCFTSPWALDSWAKNKYLAQIAGPSLPKSRRFRATPIKRPPELVRDVRGMPVV